jgi:hypothetical protein
MLCAALQVCCLLLSTKQVLTDLQTWRMLHHKYL